MSTRKQDQAVQNFQQIWQLSKTNRKQQMQWFLRGLLVIGRQPSLSMSGFVLPTTVLLLLVLGLTVTALIFRSFSRTSQVIGFRQQQEIYNAATPAIDRAKAKLEYLFTKDQRYPTGGVPPEDVLADMMHDDSQYNLPGKTPLEAETRLDLNGDGTPDNAWVYQDPATNNTIAYSILIDTQGQVNGNNVDIKGSDQNKAAAMVVRNGPIITALTSACKIQNQGAEALEQGWFRDNSSTSFLRKNFQINAVVVNSNALNKPAATLELQQERKVDRGNKWGAWFRNDLELYPEADFNWNGAIHTEGNLIVGNDNKLTVYTISSQNSCLYTQDASEVTVADRDGFQGQVVSGRITDNAFGGESKFHLFNGLGVAPIQSGNTQLKPETDSVKPDLGTLIEAISLDPVSLFTQNIFRHRSSGWSRDAAWKDINFVKKLRIFNKTSPPPYLDDTYRADNRYGPKPAYSSQLKIPSGKKVGDQITDNVAALTSNSPSTTTSDDFGLDGYWERRARAGGLRLIVGQRLELGNASGWGGANDPLNPPNTTISHEQRQWRTLRDNLAAVQATAVYHHKYESGNLPIACLATTAHPGTATTLNQSATFENVNINEAGVTSTNFPYVIDFLYGKGTNGWEFEAVSKSAFSAGTPLMTALRNLAYFAGDKEGAFPPKQESSSSTLSHPYSYLGMWGDFSNLRRVFEKYLDNGITYDNLSIADQSYLHTAACSLGMLAYQIGYFQAYDYTASSRPNLNSLDTQLQKLSDGTNTPGNPEVPVGSPPEAYIEALISKLGENPDNPNVQLAHLILGSEQIERDRIYGFNDSPPPLGNPTDSRGEPLYCDRAKYLLPGNANNGKGLAKLCFNKPKFPALHYIFPKSPVGSAATSHGEDRPSNADPDNYIHTMNTGGVYKNIADSDITASIALKPISNLSNWKLPHSSTAVTCPPGGPSNSKENIIQIGFSSPTCYQIAFKDTALFDGREMMNVRVLNVDLDMLRKNKVNNDTWIPVKDGIVYAFREDAVREDGIARPASTTWSNYKANPTNSSYVMNVNNPQDPPVNGDNNISPKPVDYYPDPDRRPYGFRLRNGTVLKRDATGISASDNIYGLSFISDNSVYIQGDFNLHSTNGTTSNLIEEFNEQLVADWSAAPNFYTGRKNINTNFAAPTNDTWRPTEIVADAITILSSNFNDGSVEDGFTKQLSSASSPSNTSYQNQNRPKTHNPGQYWLREDPYKSSDPVKVSSNGALFYCTNNSFPCTAQQEYGKEPGTPLEYRPFSDPNRTKDLVEASPTRVNAILISGIVPSRAKQSYGGFHNFPRFLEHWQNKDLYISGAFLQLNFSTSATGPFDQDAWEPAAPAQTDTYTHFYSAPNRRWGYDVGLQYQRPAPVSLRFTVPSSTRSEFYNELPIDDPYILKLRCATKLVGGGKVDPNASCS